jgi:nitrite reductase/ring-hydroxylating ferredoxin subunit
MKHSKLQFFWLICIILFTLSSSCDKQSQQPIPNVYVSFTINILTDPEFVLLQAQGNSLIIKNTSLGVQSIGYNNNGIILYNAGSDEFYAFDCTCPYDYPNSIKVTTDGGIATCPQCKSQYVLQTAGMPTTKGPSTIPLKEYKTTYNPNTGDLMVNN